MKKLLLLLTLFGTQFTVLQISQITAQAEDFSDKEESLKALKKAILNEDFNAVEHLLNEELQSEDLFEASDSLKKQLMHYLIEHVMPTHPKHNEYLVLFKKILDNMTSDLNIKDLMSLAYEAEKYNQDEMLSVIDKTIEGSDLFSAFVRQQEENNPEEEDDLFYSFKTQEEDKAREKVNEDFSDEESDSDEEGKKQILGNLRDALLNNKLEIVEDLLDKVSVKDIQKLGSSIKAQLLSYLIKQRSSKSSNYHKYLFNRIIDNIGLQLSFRTIKELADEAKEYHQNEMLSKLHNLVGSDYF